MKLLRSIQLRNPHHIYESDGNYVVTEEDRHGQSHSTPIPGRVAAYARKALAGRNVTAEDAKAVLQPVATHLNLPFTYGHKLHFYAQAVLLVLVAQNAASCEKVSRAYIYTVNPLEATRLHL